MKYLKMLGLAAVAAMAMMAIAGAGSASATILTCTNGAEEKVQCGLGTEINASVEGGTIQLTGTRTITCPTGTVKGTINTSAGSATETVKGDTTEVTFPTPECTPECSKIEVSNGELEVHTQNNGSTPNNNGTLTASGFKAVITCSGITCKYKTGNGLHMGTVTGSSTTGGTATIDIDATLVREEGFLCTSTATWEGSYKITSPDWIDVD